MAKQIFVGRQAERERFMDILAEPEGQAVVVVGQAGMGKTWLVNKLAQIAQEHPDFKCGAVRYEVTQQDSVDSRLAVMIDDAYEAADNPKKFWGGDDRGKKQWVALYKIFEAIPAAGKVFETIRGLAGSLKRDPSKDSRKQFIEKLNIISKAMGKNGRAIFIIDPEKLMSAGSDEAWAIVTKQLPDKVKLIFAQRPEDEIVKGRVFRGLKNVVHIPGKKLGVLKQDEVEDLVRLRAEEVGQSNQVLQEAIRSYKGHPYAIQAALDIVKRTGDVEKLPQDPTDEQIAEAQWEQICASGDDAIKLFEAYAVLEVGVPDEVVGVVSTLKATSRKRLGNDTYLRGLLRDEGEGKRIYHAILGEFVLGQICDKDKKVYHEWAVGLYRKRLAEAKEKQTKPDGLAAMRLAEHVLVIEGSEAFLLAFVNECSPALVMLGLFDSVISLSQRALGVVEKGSANEAVVLGNLGLIYQKQGELDKAEEMVEKSLAIEKQLGRIEGMAMQYGYLGVIYDIRGDWDKAEEMFEKALAIEEKLGRLEGMAMQYGNLGVNNWNRGELDKAEEMVENSLAIEQKLGRLEGMARQYGNLGLIYMDRGELDKAEEMFEKSLNIEEKLGRLEGMASDYGNLGLIYRRRGELDKAEKMHKKSLAIEEKLGRLEGMASDYCNLGLVYRERGDKKHSREYWEKALGLYKQMGIEHEVEKLEDALAGLGKEEASKRKK